MKDNLKFKYDNSDPEYTTEFKIYKDCTRKFNFEYLKRLLKLKLPTTKKETK